LLPRAILGGLLLAVAAAAAETDVAGRAVTPKGPARNAVVWLEAPNAPDFRQREKVVLDQRNLTFYPHVLAVRTGTVVDFPNNDQVFHNVFSFRDGKRFDLGLYPVGEVKRIRFDKPGLSRLFCNIHPKMAAYVLAVDSPYFAVADKEGRFKLRDVPSGTYTYHAWRPGSEAVKGSVVVQGGAALEVAFP
jgi:plastocyanin